MTAMTQPAPVRSLPASSRRVLDLVRHRSGRDVLLEAGDGELVDHSVATTAPAVVVHAVLSKDLASLRGAVCRQRALGVIPGGAVIAHHLAPQLVAVVVPVSAPSGRVWLWLLGPDEDLDLATVQRLAAMVAAHAPAASAADDVEALVEGRAPLPAGWSVEATTIAVVRTDAPHDVVTILRETTRAHDVPAVVGVAHGEVVALALGLDDRWLRAAAASLVELGATCQGSSCAARADEAASLCQLHARARAAAAVSDHPLRPAGALASRVAVSQAADAVAQAAVDHDPTAELLGHDTARGTDLASTLLAWLEQHGDVAEAARGLSIHTNTLRYRLRRAAELVDGDLADPDVRLDVHLRLRRALHGPGSRGVESA